MSASHPTIVIIGAGKSTVAPALLRYLGVQVFVNADSIAQGLSGLRPERKAFEASRIMLLELERLAASGESFAFESTLASRSIAPWLRRKIDNGYFFSLAYIWVREGGIAVQRVAARVRAGGHGIPETTIRRRWKRSAVNLHQLYIPLARRWYVYDNSGQPPPRRIAEGGVEQSNVIHDREVWSHLERLA